MINPPKTKKKQRSASMVATLLPDRPLILRPEAVCLWKSEPGRSFFMYQCQRKPGFGAAGSILRTTRQAGASRR